jgi:hypothetical protein
VHNQVFHDLPSYSFLLVFGEYDDVEEHGIADAVRNRPSGTDQLAIEPSKASVSMDTRVTM